MAAFKKAIHFFEYAAIRLVGGCLSLLPISFVLTLACPIGIILFLSLKHYRQKALDNLRPSFPEKSESEIQKIARDAFVYLAEFGIEWLYMSRMAKRPEHYLEIEGVEKIHTALKEGKGALLLVTHGGNWEVAALIAGFLIARPVNTIIYALARPLRNFYLYDYSLRLRSLTGLKSISKIGAVRKTFNRLKQNAVVATLVDQRVSEGSVEVNFFGRPALTTSLPALVALRLGTPVFLVITRRTPDFRFVMHVEGPIPIQVSGDLERDIQTNTQAFNNKLEVEIRKNPAHWLWMHNRWRLPHGQK